MDCDERSDFESFLQRLQSDAARRLDELPAAVCTGSPLAAARRWQEEEAAARQEAARARLDAIDTKLADAVSQETLWRERVRQRKLAERQQAEDAALAAETAAQEPPSKAPGPDSPLASARRKWAAIDSAASAARAEAEAVRSEAQKNWLESSWAPQFAQTRERVRRERELAEQQARAEREADARRLEEQLAEKAKKNALAAALAAEAAARRKEEERRVAEERRNEEIRAAEAWEQGREGRDREYLAWKRDVVAARNQGRGATNADCLEGALLRAEADRQRLLATGDSPRQAFRRACELADLQRKVRDEQAPAKAEQELWDTLLTKNRVARRHDRGSKPRWGVFTEVA
mmetsp:Transcript_31252/g.85829  ORF Transcript_31252/g.85829 Transcript_31252/m.85829 type:complete len:348 (-) Transcript_31252:94-1137(-)